MRALPATPRELLNLVHSMTDPPPWVAKKVTPALGGLCRVNAIILLTLLGELELGEPSATSHTIVERSGRNVSQAQLEALLRMGWLQRTSVPTRRKAAAHAWLIAPARLSAVVEMHATLAAFIARTNARIEVQLGLARIAARYAGCEPDHILPTHTLGRDLGIDPADDDDFFALVRQRFAIRINPLELSALVTMSDLTRLVQTKLNLRTA